MRNQKQVGIRWTIGDVSPLGFEALRLSIWGAYRIWGPSAAYAVCVNTVPLQQAQQLTGDLPDGVEWRFVTRADLPEVLSEYLDRQMSEGACWKLAPLRVFPDRYELSLDNDCILWEMPSAIRQWLADDSPKACVFAEDVLTRLGQFEELCGPEPRNSGIRGLPPGFDLEEALNVILEKHPVKLVSELDEQGLQTAAFSLREPPLVVRVNEVTICSPFPPHLPSLGTCGAHFVGLNARQLPWQLDGRPASEYVKENWLRHRAVLYTAVGVEPASSQKRRSWDPRLKDFVPGVVDRPRSTPPFPIRSV